jgi:hypothetical protein
MKRSSILALVLAALSFPIASSAQYTNEPGAKS